MKQILLLQRLLQTKTTEQSTYFHSFDFFLTQITYKDITMNKNNVHIITHLQTEDLIKKLYNVDKRLEVDYE